MGHILSRYYKMGEISEDQMKQRLGIKESKQSVNEDCGCNAVNEAGEDVNNAPIPADVKMRLQKALDVLNGKKLTYPQKLQVLGRVLDSMGIDKRELSKVTQKIKSKLEIKEDGTLQGGEKDPCWKGYEMVGMKKGKGGKEVPNCVPKN
jgi:hypothetical protein